MFLLMRHAEAGFNALSDQDRRLSEQGVESVKKMVESEFESLDIIEKVICSPYLRTQQTAALITKYLKLDDAIVEENITPNNTVKEALAAIEKHWCDNLLVITHQPLIGKLVCFLEYGDTNLNEPVSPATIYSYSLPWPGLGCAKRKALFSV